MKKLDLTEQALDHLSQLRGEPDPKIVVSELRKALKDRSNLVVARAAQLANENRATHAIPDMVAAFERLMANPIKLDKRCVALTELASALYALDYTEPEIYLRGITHVQKEASYGPPVDEAAKLRAHCALGLIRTNHPDALAKVADLIADPEPQARIGAIRAVATNGGETGEMLLRFKIHISDPDPEVLSECFTGLLESNFTRSLPLVGRFANSEDENLATSAIFALGSQRRSEAFAVLRDMWPRIVGDLRNTLLTAIAMVRLDEAADFLLELLDEVSPALGLEIIRALAAYHKDDRVRSMLQKAIEATGSASLLQAFQTEW